MRHLFNVVKYPLFSWQLLSHKALRYLAFIPMILALVAKFALIDDPVYIALLAGQFLFFSLAVVGHFSLEGSMPFYVSLPYYFLLLNLACAHAFWRLVKGERQAVWNPREG